MVGREVHHLVEDGVHANKSAVRPRVAVRGDVADVSPRPADAVRVAHHVAAQHAELGAAVVLDEHDVVPVHPSRGTWCVQIKLIPGQAVVVGVRHLTVVSRSCKLVGRIAHHVPASVGRHVKRRPFHEWIVGRRVEQARHRRCGSNVVVGVPKRHHDHLGLAWKGHEKFVRVFVKHKLGTIPHGRSGERQHVHFRVGARGVHFAANQIEVRRRHAISHVQDVVTNHEHVLDAWAVEFRVRRGRGRRGIQRALVKEQERARRAVTSQTVNGRSILGVFIQGGHHLPAAERRHARRRRVGAGDARARLVEHRVGAFRRHEHRHRGDGGRSVVGRDRKVAGHAAVHGLCHRRFLGSGGHKKAEAEGRGEGELGGILHRVNKLIQPDYVSTATKVTDFNALLSITGARRRRRDRIAPCLRAQVLDAGAGTVLRHLAVARVQRGRHHFKPVTRFACEAFSFAPCFRAQVLDAGANEKPDALSCIGLVVAGTGLEPATFGL